MFQCKVVGRYRSIHPFWFLNSVYDVRQTLSTMLRMHVCIPRNWAASKFTFWLAFWTSVSWKLMLLRYKYDVRKPNENLDHGQTFSVNRVVVATWKEIPEVVVQSQDQVRVCFSYSLIGRELRVANHDFPLPRAIKKRAHYARREYYCMVVLQECTCT